MLTCIDGRSQASLHSFPYSNSHPRLQSRANQSQEVIIVKVKGQEQAKNQSTGSQQCVSQGMHVFHTHITKTITG